MKINFNKIIFLTFLIIAFSINVNAGVLNCGEGSITIKETSKASPSGMTATMPICAKTTQAIDKSGPMFITVTDKPGLKLNKKDPHAVAEYGKTSVEVTAISADNKTNVNVNVQVCNDKRARLKAKMICSYRINKKPVKKCQKYVTKPEAVTDEACLRACQFSAEILQPSGLIENPNVEQMRQVIPEIKDCSHCTKIVPKQVCAKYSNSYTCEEGGHETWNGEEVCVDYWTYETNVPIDSNGITVAQAETACEGKNATDCLCKPNTVEYNLQCPVYLCEKGDVQINMCTPDFEESKTGNDVYCVNPSQPFSSEYIKDKSFNIKECDSSYGTVDCGYANILIEGEYHKLDKKVIELALRLWGVYTNQSGFEKVGVSGRRTIDGYPDCSTHVYYMRDDNNKIVNPYKKTFEEFNKVLLNKVRDKSYIDPSADVSMFTLTCDSSKLGVACGESSTTKQAFALLANTIIGNDKMQDHLSELFGGEISEKVKSVNLINDANREQYIEVHFTELKKILEEKDVEINCKKLDQMVRNGVITKEQKAQIEPYCKIEVSIVDGRGNVLSRNSNLTPEYCYKDYCRVKTKNFAICDLEKEVTTPIKVKVTYNKSNSSKGINKYVSCSNPTKNQIMMGFDDELLTNINSGDPNKENSSEKVTDEFIISNYKCAGSCDDYSLRGEVQNKCSDDTKNYNKTYNSSIKDPSLKCILNMGSPTYKEMYDYSDYFGVNTNFCRVYCSDEVKYYIADKVKAKSGTLFYYDIEQSVKGGKNIKYLFSNIVKEKRSCVSEIYYKNGFSENIDWKKLYKLGIDRNYDGIPDDGITQAEIDGITNWSTLFSVLVKKSLNDGGRTDDLNKLIYDLYNCNLYSESEINANGITRPRNDRTGNVRSNIIDKFSKRNNYGLGPESGCSITDTSNTCVTMKNITYEFGAKPNGNKAVMKSVTTNKNTFDKLVYCSGNDCFAYSEETKDNEYNYPTSTRNETSYVNLRTSDGYRLYLNGRSRIEIPTNDYVMFETSTEMSFYNSSKYEVKPSGEVIFAGTNTTGERYMQLKPFTYPINKNAYNLPACTSRDFLKDSNRCKITQQYDRFETYYRKNENDDFLSKIKLSNKFSCFVDVTKPTTIPCSEPNTCNLRNSTTYRNVDPSNIFPSSSNGYTTNPNSNWATEIGKKATDEIRNSSDDLIVTNDYLEYRITLSPNQIQNIKQYNKDNDSYIDEQVTKCQIVNDTYQNCLSPFMDELRRSNEYGTIDPNYSYGKSIKSNQNNQKEKYYNQ